VFDFGRRGTKPGTLDQPVDLILNSSEDQLFITAITESRFCIKRTIYEIQLAYIIHQMDICLVSSHDTHCMLVFEEDGMLVSAIEGTYQGKERFDYPCGVVMMDSGHNINFYGVSKLLVL